ncbi:unnamed protein product [Malassezia sympodialis ATCC 42132]|uniref:uncharacterized protein n=1 Tax=Malassezia sympodialis (strain ATCC 42132) TaxID=1230383 RepID=UPI0002C1D3E8|nr:uncharacterized protein MSY001_2073 [Malassezia sympodialis ATCC 42132]CCU99367.1 unnamed protein product [Malassezia sympodialis ATCC 42132]|eukprot:XP_018740621.1 uncharacterized protein MSY001_2073 [Malassezia sympodialis ATCC 42132]
MFRNMSAEIDEDEHSLEMHYPYIRHVWSRRDVRVVPILVGSLSPSVAEEYAKILQPFAADPNTMFIVSSDFCHWGLRFRYTRYQAGSRELPVILNALTPPDVYAKYPIHASITDLDTEAMSAISFSSGRASIACQKDRDSGSVKNNEISFHDAGWSAGGSDYPAIAYYYSLKHIFSDN